MCLESPPPMADVEDEDAEWVCDHCCALAEALAIVIETDSDVDAETVAELANALEAAAVAVDPLGGPAAGAEPDPSDPVTGMRLAAIAAAAARAASPSRADGDAPLSPAHGGGGGSPAGRTAAGSSRKRRRSASVDRAAKSGRRAPQVDYAMLNALMFEGTSPSARSRSAGTSDDEFVGTLREDGAPSTDSDGSSSDDSSSDDSSSDGSSSDDGDDSDGSGDDDDGERAGQGSREAPRAGGRGGARAAAAKARSLISAEVVAAPAAADSSEDDEDFDGAEPAASEDEAGDDGGSSSESDA
ncbi:hypothetical protein FNF31_02831 [Cafeteria roenbergensis]|uniref:Uncharacterized protein n=1 Tax=Cafeteria roenbergensis TaxID=33653 RepID=A0A5A8D2L8_CAFRO|nr:hypothetical protein FNF28_06340 [Cafeteria roenbergensis]KAA0163437.1 hypothetical protein FNF31_02831 [Cafeteria roenbergensis]